MRTRRYHRGINDPQILIANALVNLDPSSIVTSGSNVTAWNNIGAGGSAYNLNVIVGTAANLTTTTVNGYPSVATSGSVGLESTSETDIPQPATLIVVAKYNALPVDFGVLISSRSEATASANLYWDTASTANEEFKAFANGGSPLSVIPADTNRHVFSVVYNGASSLLKVSGIGFATGNPGAEEINFLSLFINNLGAFSSVADASQLLIFPYALSLTQINALESFLKAKFAAT